MSDAARLRVLLDLLRDQVIETSYIGPSLAGFPSAVLVMRPTPSWSVKNLCEAQRLHLDLTGGFPPPLPIPPVTGRPSPPRVESAPLTVSDIATDRVFIPVGPMSLGRTDAADCGSISAFRGDAIAAEDGRDVLFASRLLAKAKAAALTSKAAVPVKCSAAAADCRAELADVEANEVRRVYPCVARSKVQQCLALGWSRGGAPVEMRVHIKGDPRALDADPDKAALVAVEIAFGRPNY